MSQKVLEKFGELEKIEKDGGLEKEKAETNKPNESDSNKSDLYNKNTRCCFVRIPSLNSKGEGEYDYFSFDLRAFSDFDNFRKNYAFKYKYKDKDNKFENNKVPLAVLSHPFNGAMYACKGSSFWYYRDLLNRSYFEKVKNKDFVKNEYSDFLPILEKIHNLESGGGEDGEDGEITKYNKFIDELPCTTVDYKKTDDYEDYDKDKSKVKVYDFCAAANAAKNKELYDRLVDLVNNYLVPLGRELSKCISSKFEKEENEIKKRDIYLRCIPFVIVETKYSIPNFMHTPPEEERLKFINDVMFGSIKYLKIWLKHCAEIGAYLEQMFGFGTSFYCKEYNQDAKYEFWYQKLECHSKGVRSNIQGNAIINIKPTGFMFPHYDPNGFYNCIYFLVDEAHLDSGIYIPIEEPDDIFYTIVYIEKLKAEYLVSKKLELLKNKDELINYKGELIRQLKDGITFEYYLDCFTPEKLQSIGVENKYDLEKKLDNVKEKACSDKVLERVVEDAIKESKYNSEIKKLSDDIENIIQEAADKIMENLVREGNKIGLTVKEMKEMVNVKLLGLDIWCRLGYELMMKLEYEIDKLIHDKKYDGINKEKMFRVYRELIPGISPRYANLRDVIGEKLEEFLWREIHPLEINTF